MINRRAELLQELIEALNLELKAVQEKERYLSYSICNGKQICMVEDYAIFEFPSPGHIPFMDSVCKITIEDQQDAKNLDAIIYSISDTSLKVGVKGYFNAYIDKSILNTSLSFLIEMLIDKLKESDFGLIESSPVCDLLFFPGHRLNSARERSFPVSNKKERVLNHSQIKAVEASLNNPLSFIWGPPGTGKTTTIASVIEEHIDSGMRVLLVSHANNAVDEALFKTALNMKGTDFYKNGQLIRIGHPQEKHRLKLNENTPFVFSSNILKKKYPELFREKEELENSLRKLEVKKDELRKFLDVHVRVAEKEKKIKSVYGEFETKQNKISRLRREGKKLVDSDQIEKEIDKLHQESLENLNIISFYNEEVKKSKEERKKFLQRFPLFSLATKLNPKLIDDRISKLNKDIKLFNFRLRDITEEIRMHEITMVEEARLVATTLTKTYSSDCYFEKPFDVLVLDEASMALLPYIYIASLRCHSLGVIVGDPLQLAPISQASAEDNYSRESRLIQNWLKTNIYGLMGIDTIESASNDPRVTLLEEQYRMSPDIANISNQLFYKGCLKNHNSVHSRVFQYIEGESPLVLINTGKISRKQYRTRFRKGGSPFNPYNALVCVTTAERILDANDNIKIGIITPYAAQASFILKVLIDRKLSGRINVGTVHRYQGGEEDIIIFDTVLNEKLNKSLLFDEFGELGADLLLNVAVTRAKHQFFLIGNLSILIGYSGSAIIQRITRMMANNGSDSFQSDRFITELYDHDFETWLPGKKDQLKQNELFAGDRSSGNMWKRIKEDFDAARKSIFIYSRNILSDTVRGLLETFSNAVNRKVEVCLVSNWEAVPGHKRFINSVSKRGIKVGTAKGLKYNVITIDDRLFWEGEVSVLGHKNDGKIMVRLEGEAVTSEMKRIFQIGQKCKLCDGFMVLRESIKGELFGCSNFNNSDGCKYKFST